MSAGIAAGNFSQIDERAKTTLFARGLRSDVRWNCRRQFQPIKSPREITPLIRRRPTTTRNRPRPRRASRRRCVCQWARSSPPALSHCVTRCERRHAPYVITLARPDACEYALRRRAGRFLRWPARAPRPTVARPVAQPVEPDPCADLEVHACGLGDPDFVGGGDFDNVQGGIVRGQACDPGPPAAPVRRLQHVPCESSRNVPDPHRSAHSRCRFPAAELPLRNSATAASTCSPRLRCASSQ